jgi:hypothetical protein
MSKKAQAVVGVVLLAAAVFLSFRSRNEQRQSSDFPDGAHWLCLKCGQGFSTSLKEVSQWSNSDPAGGYPCAKCKAVETVRAKKCPLPACGKFYVERNLVIDEKACCPLCRNPLP